jgi:uncharacterized protein (TIGR03437 family)
MVLLVLLLVIGRAFAVAQNPSGRRQLLLNQETFRLRPGEPTRILAPSADGEFLRTAKVRSATAAGRKGFVFGPDMNGDMVLAASLTTPPGEYVVTVSATSEDGEERSAIINVVLNPLQSVPANATRPPVILLNGLQFGLSNGGCPISTSPLDTFGPLAGNLRTDGVPVVYFFDNCIELANGLIEDLGSVLGQVIGLIRYDTGALVPQIDLIGHSMGGLIIRSYLAGLHPDGTLSPPRDVRVRKVIQIATPNFGSFIASTVGTQMAEMIPGSPFLWNLATWNGRGDDLRGVDALAVIGNGGYAPRSGFPPEKASDGVVSVTSASLSFARDSSRTRILAYCHADFGMFDQAVVDCQGSGIAKALETAQIIHSFLSNTTAWQLIGKTPPEDAWLSRYGGMFFGMADAKNQWVSDLTSVSFGTGALSPGGVMGRRFYSSFVSGTDTFHMVSKSQGNMDCGPVTEPIGYFTTWRCKASPIVSAIGPLLPVVPGRVVQSGGTVIINGVGFGPRCAACKVVAYPGQAALTISSWTDQAISVNLPSTFDGIAQIAVQTAVGSDSLTFMTSAPPFAAPSAVVTSITNSASGVSDAVAPGEIITIKGNGLGPTAGVSFAVDSATNTVATALADTRVMFGSFAAPITYTSAGQVNAIVPYEVAGLTQVPIQVQYHGAYSVPQTFQVAAASPAAFTFNSTGSGTAIAANQDGIFNGPSSPAEKGSYVTIYFTGGGQTNPAGVTGSITRVGLKWLTQPIMVTVGGQSAAVLFDGAAPGLIDGLGQLNIQLSPNTPSGPAQSLIITVGGISSTANATLAVR